MRDQVLFTGTGLVSVLVGLPLARRLVRPNRWYGVRVPATFADEQVWYEANAVAGRDLMALGALLLLVALGLPRIVALPPVAYGLVCTLVLVTGSMIAVIRAWRLANRLLRERRGRAGQPPLAPTGPGM
jgi:uncharacterized membrane protein